MPVDGKFQLEGPALGTCAIVVLVLVVLKLAKQIDWGWIWILSPLWLPWAAFAGIFLVLSIVWLAAETVRRVLRS